VQASIK